MILLYRRLLNFLWRMHEESLWRRGSVKCDGGEGNVTWHKEKSITMNAKQIDNVMRVLLDEEAHQAFAAAVDTHEPAMDPDVVEELEKVAETFRRKRQEEVSVIVITRLAPPDTGLKCLHEGKWHLLINTLTWIKLKQRISGMSLQAPFPLLGIPVVEDEELARQVLISAYIDGGGAIRFDGNESTK